MFKATWYNILPRQRNLDNRAPAECDVRGLRDPVAVGGRVAGLGAEDQLLLGLALATTARVGLGCDAQRLRRRALQDALERRPNTLNQVMRYLLFQQRDFRPGLRDALDRDKFGE